MVRVAINGFGRIGRCVTRVLVDDCEGFELVAVNDLTDDATLGHLLKYDSVHRHFPGDVKVGKGVLEINGKEVVSLEQRDPSKLPWKDLGVDIVLECTGAFRTQEKASMHLAAGAKKVLLSAPGKGEIDGTFCVGINHRKYRPKKDNVISNASCTTNCLAPVAKILNQRWGIERGLMTTIHSYTSSQRILDFPHKDLRRARACAVNMIPTTTGAAAAVGLVLPELKGKLDGMAIRVPTPNVSLVDLTVNLTKPTTENKINAAFRAAAKRGPLVGILMAVDEPLVSIDFLSEKHSSCVDLGTTMVADDGKLVKVLSWYDNEYGYSARMWDLCKFVGSKL